MWHFAIFLWMNRQGGGVLRMKCGGQYDSPDLILADAGSGQEKCDIEYPEFCISQ